MIETHDDSRPTQALTKPGSARAVPIWQRTYADIPERFQVLETLGQGGMGTVYRVLDAELGIEVALKTLRGIAPQERQHLKAEFRLLANLYHPNLVELYELFADLERCLFTMELVRGTDFLSSTQVLDRDAPQFMRTFAGRARQLASAITYLHASGRLHRDIKPSNVLVSEGGRVVLLDFGIAASLDDLTADPADAWQGTLPYVAPEIWSAGGTSFASDWYSFGVTLYEALADRLAFEGSVANILRQKRATRFHDPAGLLRTLPEPLRGLIEDLIAPDPRDRPSGTQVLDALSALVVEPLPPLTSHLPRARPSQLVNRLREIEVLRASLRAHASGARLVEVAGHSGIGKTELVQKFLEQVSEAGALVLSARCHPRETVPFNAVDGLVDGLFHTLEHMPERERRALMPDDVGALARLFPAFKALSPASEPPVQPTDTIRSLRGRALRALRSLLQRLSASAQLILWIDDAQWGDDDSWHALRVLFEAPDAPRALLIVSHAFSEGARSARVARVSDELERLPVGLRHRVSLGPLGRQVSQELLAQLLSEPAHAQRAREVVERLLDAAEGSPFLLCTLAQEARRAELDAQSMAPLDLSALIEAEVAALAEDERRLLDVFAVAGHPVLEDVALDAAGVGPDARVAVTLLLKRQLIKASSSDRRWFEIYHHRLQSQLVQRLPAETLRACHRALGDALGRQPQLDPASIVDHYLAAERAELAQPFVMAAALSAERALAFERAAGLYRRAITLSVPNVDPLELRVRFAQALANAGRGRQAGEAFEEAAQIAAAKPDTSAARLFHLRRRAAEQYLQSGYDELAMSTLNEVLGQLGVRVPRTPEAAMLRSVLLRARTAVRRLPVSDGLSAPENRADVARVLSVWALAMRISMVNHSLVSYLAAACANEALRTRDASLTCRALALEAVTLALLPSGFAGRRADRMLQTAERMATASGDSYDRAILLGGRGGTRWLRGQWREAIVDFDDSAALLSALPKHAHWETVLWDSWRLAAFAHQGDLQRLVSGVQERIERARKTEDRFTARNASLGQPTLAWLATGQAEYAQALADRAIAWSPANYTTQHYHYYLSCTLIDVYNGAGESAWRRTLSEWSKLRRNVFLAAACVRDELLHMRARSALCYADVLRRRGEQRAARRMLRDAGACADAIEAHGIASARVWVAMIRAGVFAQQGQGARAQSTLRSAMEQCESLGIALQRSVCHYLLTGRDAPEGVAEPARLADVIVPGFARRKDRRE